MPIISCSGTACRRTFVIWPPTGIFLVNPDHHGGGGGDVRASAVNNSTSDKDPENEWRRQQWQTNHRVLMITTTTRPRTKVHRQLSFVIGAGLDRVLRV
jgi:hypothetical protein